MEKEQATSVLLRNIAAQFRDELSALYLIGWKLTPPERRKVEPLTDKNAAFADQCRLRMTRLVQNMEADADLRSGAPLERENGDIVRLVSEICEESADLTEYAGVRLMFSCAVEAHVCAIHSEYIRQLTYHLMSNALKSSARGGYVRVSLRFPSSPRRILLSVEDNGRGIAADRLPAIFDDGLTEFDSLEQPHGVGLGLSICKRIAEGHGGSLSVKSELGKGSEFTLNIPDTVKKTVKFIQPDFYVKNGGVHPSLIGLADALPSEAFQIRNLL